MAEHPVGPRSSGTRRRTAVSRLLEFTVACRRSSGSRRSVILGGLWTVVRTSNITNDKAKVEAVLSSAADGSPAGPTCRARPPRRRALPRSSRRRPAPSAGRLDGHDRRHRLLVPDDERRVPVGGTERPRRHGVQPGGRPDVTADAAEDHPPRGGPDRRHRRKLEVVKNNVLRPARVRSDGVDWCTDGARRAVGSWDDPGRNGPRGHHRRASSWRRSRCR